MSDEKYAGLIERNHPRDLSSLYTQLDNYYSAAHGDAETDDAFYEQSTENVKLDLPAGVAVHIPSTPTQIVDNMSDQLSLNHPVVSLRPRGDSQLVSKLVSWGIDRLRHVRDYAMFNAFEFTKKDLLRVGAGCTKLVIAEDMLPPVPERKDYDTPDAFDEAMKQYEIDKAAHEPFYLVPINPLSVYPAPGCTTPLPFVLEAQTKTVMDMRQFSQWTDPKGRALVDAKQNEDATNPAREVLWLEFWSAPITDDKGEVIDPGWYMIEVDGQVIVEEENPYGFVPYTFEWSGLGRHHPTGDPKFLMRGLLSKVRGELAAEIRVKTAIEAQYQYHVFPVLSVRANAAKAAAMLRAGPGKVIEWGQLGDEQPQWLTVPPPNEQMLSFLAQIQQALTRVSAPVLSGSGSGEYGILEAMRVGNALKIVDPVVNALNRMAGFNLAFMARLAKLRNLSFKVRTPSSSATLNGDDFNRFDFEVKFERSDAAENERRMLVGESLHSKGKISFDTFHRDFSKFGDPEGEFEKVIAEKLVMQMVDTGMLGQLVMQKLAGALAQTQSAASGVAQQALGGGISATPFDTERGAEAAAATPGLANPRQEGVV